MCWLQCRRELRRILISISIAGLAVVVLLFIHAELHRVAAHCAILCSKGASEVNAAAMQREGGREREGVRKQSGAEIWAEKECV